MSRKIVYAKLHTGVFIPGVGNLSDTLPPAGKTLRNFTMSTKANGNLYLSWEDERAATNQAAEVGVSNISIIAYEPIKLVKNNA
jgi:hypothetical protein